MHRHVSNYRGAFTGWGEVRGQTKTDIGETVKACVPTRYLRLHTSMSLPLCKWVSEMDTGIHIRTGTVRTSQTELKYQSSRGVQTSILTRAVGPGRGTTMLEISRMSSLFSRLFIALLCVCAVNKCSATPLSRLSPREPAKTCGYEVSR